MTAPSTSPTAPRPGVLRRIWESWATRSLAVGAVATAIDVAVLLAVVGLLAWPNAAASAVGVTVGSTFTFFANRHFAFRDHTPQLAPQAIKFVISTGVALLLHAWLVWFLADQHGVHVVLAKLVADLLVFTGGQLLVLRYLVFPRAKVELASEVMLIAPSQGEPALRTSPERAAL